MRSSFTAAFLTVTLIILQHGPCLAATNNRAQEFYAEAARLSHDKNYEQALDYANKAVEIEPNKRSYLYLKAVLEREMPNLKAAVATCERALTLFPDDETFEELYANSLDSLGRHAEALAAFNKALKKHPTQAIYLHEKANCLFSMHRDEDAWSTVQAAIKAAPTDHGVLFTHCQIAAAMKKWDVVARDAKLRIPDEQFRSYAYRDLGAAYRHLKQYDKSVDAYRQGIRKWPDDRELHVGLRDTLFAMGDKPGAAREDKIIKECDEDIQPFK